jgi:circadian clock protein KaiB
VKAKAPLKAGRAGSRNRTRAFEKALEAKPRGTYVLKLYVTGTTARSVAAVANIKKICEEHLKGRYRLEVIDIYQQPELAAREQLVVAPTLIKKLPLPLRTFIGDLSETQKVLVGLDLEAKKA